MPTITLPNGKQIKGVPTGTSKEDIMAKAIASGLATQEDFNLSKGKNDSFKAAPEKLKDQDSSISEFLLGKEGERSVFNSPELNEFSLRALKSGIGGLLTGDTKDIKSIIGTNYPEAEFGDIDGQAAVRLPSGDYFLQPEGLDLGDITRFGTDVAAFTPAGRVTGLGLGALAKGAVAAGTTQAIQEGIEAGVGGEFDTTEVLTEAAFGPAAQILGPALKATGSKAKDIYGAITEKLAKNTDDATRVGSALSSVKSKRVIPELLANPEIMKAADDLGVSLNPAHYSGSEIYKEYEIGLKSVPGSLLSTNEKEAVNTLSSKADELIEEFGGTIDKSTLSESVKKSMQGSIDAIKTEEGVIYKAVEDVIPKSLRVKPNKTLEYLKQRINDLGGVNYLSPGEKEAYSSLSGRGKNLPTYQRMVEARRNVHSPSGINTPFANTDKRIRDNLYNAIKEDERGIVGFFSNDLLNDYDKALEIGAKRFKMQDEMVSTFGKDLSKSLFKGIRTGVRDLSQGDIGSFSKAMKTVPEDLREQVAVSALNDVFTQGSRASKEFSMGGFANAWSGIKRNKQSYDAIKEYIPKKAIDRLDNIYLVSKGILDANKKDLANPSGSARGILNGMMNDGGLISKLYGAGGKILAAESITTPSGLGGVGTAGVLGSIISQGKSTTAELADRMLTNPKFKESVNAYLKGDKEKAGRIIEGIGTFKRWFDAQPAEVKRSIARRGIMEYLTEEEPEDE
jgi:hypothetical protein